MDTRELIMFLILALAVSVIALVASRGQAHSLRRTKPDDAESGQSSANGLATGDQPGHVEGDDTSPSQSGNERRTR